MNKSLASRIMSTSAPQATANTFEFGEYHEPHFVVNRYYINEKTERIYRCVRVDSDGYVVLTRLTPEGLVEIDPAPEYWKFFKHVVSKHRLQLEGLE